MKELVVTVGLPRSGKSTWAKTTGCPIVNRDSIRLALHGEQYLQPAENMVSVIEECMVNALFLAGHETVIVDACHHTEKRRKRWEEFCEKGNILVLGFKFFATDKETCIERAGDDNVIIPVIERMSEEMDCLDNIPMCEKKEE